MFCSRSARTIYRTLEEIGYDAAFAFEAKHDPFLPLAVAAVYVAVYALLVFRTYPRALAGLPSANLVLRRQPDASRRVPPSRRPLRRWMARATIDLPVPLSPVISTVALVSATEPIMSKIFNMR